MPSPRSERPSDDSREVRRVTEEVASRLRRSGVLVLDNDSPEQLVRLLDAVEAFEHAVQRRGGDLMVDEPPDAALAEPDNPAFLLPARSADESTGSYIRRLEIAVDAMRGRRPTD